MLFDNGADHFSQYPGIIEIRKNLHTPLITTILRTYRRPQLLQRAIQSVLDQTFSSWELLILDNASGDETAEVVASFSDHRIRYICHPDNLGHAANINAGIALVQTPYLSILADDDSLLPWFYNEALEGFDRESNASFFAGQIIPVSLNGTPLPCPVPSWECGSYRGMEILLKNNFLNTTAALFKTDLIQKLGGIDGSLPVVCDIEIQLRLAQHHSFVVSTRPCALFTLHDEAYSARVSVKEFAKQSELMVHKLDYLPSLQAWREKHIAVRWLRPILNEDLEDLRFCIDWLENQGKRGMAIFLKLTLHLAWLRKVLRWARHLKQSRRLRQARSQGDA